MQEFWRLTEGMEDPEFDWLIDQLLLAESSAKGSQWSARRTAADFGRCKRARELLDDLRKTLGIGDELWEDCVDPEISYIADHLDHASALLDHWREDKLVRRRSRTSRKVQDIPRTLFIAGATAAMRKYLGDPHVDVIADLVSMVFNVEVQPDTVRKIDRRENGRFDF